MALRPFLQTTSKDNLFSFSFQISWPLVSRIAHGYQAPGNISEVRQTVRQTMATSCNAVRRWVRKLEQKGDEVEQKVLEARKKTDYEENALTGIQR